MQHITPTYLLRYAGFFRMLKANSSHSSHGFKQSTRSQNIPQPVLGKMRAENAEHVGKSATAKTGKNVQTPISL